MAWTTPKTDWKSTDFFNPQDYNRILTNLEFLKNYANKLYEITDFPELGDFKTYLSTVFAREINAMELALERINECTYKADIGETKTYETNGHTIDYNELNRLENGMITIYERLASQHSTLKTFAFGMGKQFLMRKGAYTVSP